MIYVTSDLHGYSLENFQDFLDRVGFGKDDILYILGDVIDRGTDGVKILRWMMRQRNVKFLLGNHEEMLLSCDFLFEDGFENSVSGLTGNKLFAYNVWTSNSGGVTLNALSAVRNSEIRYMLEYLRKAPLYVRLNVSGRDFVLVHSGLGGFSEEKPLSEYTQKELVWERPKLETEYFKDITVIFGHTCTFRYGEEHLGRILKNNNWINVDVGVGVGQQPALLRLDDMKEFYYKEMQVN